MCQQTVLVLLLILKTGLWVYVRTYTLYTHVFNARLTLNRISRTRNGRRRVLQSEHTRKRALPPHKIRHLYCCVDNTRGRTSTDRAVSAGALGVKREKAKRIESTKRYYQMVYYNYYCYCPFLRQSAVL